MSPLTPSARLEPAAPRVTLTVNNWGSKGFFGVCIALYKVINMNIYIKSYKYIKTCMNDTFGVCICTSQKPFSQEKRNDNLNESLLKEQLWPFLRWGGRWLQFWCGSWDPAGL